MLCNNLNIFTMNKMILQRIFHKACLLQFHNLLVLRCNIINFDFNQIYESFMINNLRHSLQKGVDGSNNSQYLFYIEKMVAFWR